MRQALNSLGRRQRPPLYVSNLSIDTTGNPNAPPVQRTFDDLARNYRISPTVTQFDRSADVLQQDGLAQ